ncbi:MAG: ATP-binding protein [Syntrophales bacterium]|nr:ATP-binding protein [Syntrophales bacterium]
MKNKIIIGLAIFALMFFFGGIYIVTTTETTIYDLHRLSKLHQTVALRKELLLSIKKNQSNIVLRSRRFMMEETSVDAGMMGIVKKCPICHHSSPSGERIAHLINQIEMYLDLTRDIFTVAPGSAISENRAVAALRMGDDLIDKVELIVDVTSTNLEKQERNILRKIQERKYLLFLLVTIGPFFAVGLAFFLIHGLTKPLTSLLEATRRLKTGDLDHRIKDLHDEFGEVAASFNEMAASLKGQMHELQRTEQLRVCGEMAAGLAHEIRNPLAGMKISIEVLLSELNLEQRDREVLLRVIEQIRNIELLMKNLLSYARPVASQPVRFNINKILEKTVYFIEKHPSFVSGDPRKQVIKELDDQLPEIVGDPQQLQQVFLNLLLNAAEAIGESGNITVKTGHDMQVKTVSISLKDTGSGIAAELQEKIFQPFFTTKGKGTGLGLAVSKRIVEEHGGNIKVANNVDGGVTFTITLPIKMDDRGLTQ